MAGNPANRYSPQASRKTTPARQQGTSGAKPARQSTARTTPAKTAPARAMPARQPAARAMPAQKSIARAMPAQQQGTGQPLVNVSGLMGGMQVSQQGVPYQYLVPPADPGEDPGYLRPPTQQDMEYSQRLGKARAYKESGEWPASIDPVLLEQRITAAERQPHGAGWKKDVSEPLRDSQYPGDQIMPESLQNMGSALKGGADWARRNVVPFAFLPGGALSRGGSGPTSSYDRDAAVRSDIAMGYGTSADENRRWSQKEADYRHKYYGAPESPQSRNVYDTLGMPQPVQGPPDYDYGQRDVPTYLTNMGKRAELDFGPAKVAPPGSEWGLPAGALEPQGMAFTPHLSQETRDLIKSGKISTEKMPPKVQNYIKRTLEGPKTSGALSGGRGGGGGKGGKEMEGEKEGKKTFNLLDFLLQLLGLGGLFGQDKGGGKKKQDSNSGQGRDQGGGQDSVIQQRVAARQPKFTEADREYYKKYQSRQQKPQGQYAGNSGRASR